MMGNKSMRGYSGNPRRYKTFKEFNRILMEEADTIIGNIRKVGAVLAGGFTGLISSGQRSIIRSKKLNTH